MSKNPIPLVVNFLSDPLISPVGRGEQWRVHDDWYVQVISVEGELTTFMVPAGFITDLASVPRLPGAYMLFGNRARRAAIMHDYLYSIQMERELADSVFYGGMADEVSNPGRYMMWLAVRVGGASYYSVAPSRHPETDREAP